MATSEALSDAQILQEAAQELLEERAFRLIFRGATLTPNGFRYLANPLDQRVMQLNADAAGLTFDMPEHDLLQRSSLPATVGMLRESGMCSARARSCVRTLMMEILQPPIISTLDT